MLRWLWPTPSAPETDEWEMISSSGMQIGGGSAAGARSRAAWGGRDGAGQLPLSAILSPIDR